MFPFQKCESVFSHADTDENETQKKLHFHSSYLQLRGAFPLVSEMSFLAKAMQPPIVTGTWGGEAGISAPGMVLHLQAPLPQQESYKGWWTAWDCLSGQEDLVAGTSFGTSQDVKGFMSL